MWKYRVIYALTLIGSTLFLVLYPLWFSWYLTVSLLLLLPLDLIISMPGMLSRQISLAAPKVLEQGGDAKLMFTMPGKKRLPVKFVKLRLKISGEDFTFRVHFKVGPECGSVREMKIDTSYSGLMVFESKRIWKVSLLGLFCIPAVFKRRFSVLVLPPPVEPPQTEALPSGVLLHPKPGGGFSDDHDLRPFRSGDAIRSVHWKVSAKLDSLVIREPLEPLTHSRLIRAAGWNTARERDLILGRLRWASEYLLEYDLPHYVSLDIGGSYAEITKIADLYDYLRLVLDNMADTVQYHINAPVRFVWVLQIDATE